MKDLVYRYLRGYSIDPGFSTQLETMEVNEMIYKVQWEELQAGPIGEYIEVIDMDPTTNYFYEPVDLNDKQLLSESGLPPAEGNAKFHQQFVYAVIMQTIENFERALGRKILWKTRVVKTGNTYRKYYVPRLRVYPHAMREANALYTEEKMALLFGYFEAGSKIQGSNFPGGTVFTCLSPDIIAHETTHAILDGIHPRYLENTNPDVPAFHEAFSDIVALLQRFSNSKLLEHQLTRTRGRLDEYSVLGELATQFGQALKTGRGALRSAIGEYDDKSGKWRRIDPNPAAYKTLFKAHDRGAILVATIFDAFIRLYQFRIQDLIRIATQGTGILPQGALHPDLIKRLSLEASKIASHLLAICIRAIDYCPPFDITFGKYLRALITADKDLCPTDDKSYRVSLIEAFRAWGIFPDRLFTLSIYNLPWSAPELNGSERAAMQFTGQFLKQAMEKVLGITKRANLWQQYDDIQSSLHYFILNPMTHNKKLWNDLKLKQKTWDSFLAKLGLVFTEVKHEYRGEKLKFKNDNIPKLEVHSVRQAIRLGSEDRPLIQLIVALTQTLVVESGQYEGSVFRGGSTLIFSEQENKLSLDYIIVNSIKNVNRLTKQFDYQAGRNPECSISELTYGGSSPKEKIDFEHLHFH